MFVYVFHTRGACKIGISRNPEKRLATLQAAAFKPLRIVETHFVGSDSHARAIERAALADMQTRYERRGEWFRAPAWAGYRALRAAIRNFDPKAVPPSIERPPRQKKTAGSGIGELEW
jgi:hypothetical protein